MNKQSLQKTWDYSTSYKVVNQIPPVFKSCSPANIITLASHDADYYYFYFEYKKSYITVCIYITVSQSILTNGNLFRAFVRCYIFKYISSMHSQKYHFFLSFIYLMQIENSQSWLHSYSKKPQNNRKYSVSQSRCGVKL